MVVYCCAYGCATKKADGKPMHMLPKNPEVRARWVRAIGRNDWTPKIYHRLCSDHFLIEDYDPTYMRKKTLRPGVVPSIFNVSSTFDVMRSRKMPLVKRDIGQTSPEPRPAEAETPAAEGTYHPVGLLSPVSKPSILPDVILEQSLDIQELGGFRSPTLQEQNENEISTVKVEIPEVECFPQETVYLPSSSAELLPEDSDYEDGSNANFNDSSISDGELVDPFQTKMFMSRQIQCEMGMEKYQLFVALDDDGLHPAQESPLRSSINIVGGSQDVDEPVDTYCSMIDEDVKPRPCLLTGDLMSEGLNGNSITASFIDDRGVQCELGGETCKSAIRRATYGRYVCVGGVDCPCGLPKPEGIRRSKVILEIKPRRRNKSTDRVRGLDCSEDAASQNQIIEDAASQNQISEDGASQNQMSEDEESQNQIIEDAASQNQMSEDAASQNQMSEDAASQNQMSEEAGSQNQMQHNLERRNSYDEDQTSSSEVDNSTFYYHLYPRRYPRKDVFIKKVKNYPPPKPTFFNVVDVHEVRKKVASIIHKRSTPNILRRNNRTNVKR